MRPRIGNRLLGIAALLALTVAAVPADEPGPKVTLVETASSFTLANGLVTARVEKRDGTLSSLKYRGLELLGRASGKAYAYWSHNGGGSLGASRESVVLVNPAANGGARAVVACRFPRSDGRRGLPADVEMRFALGRGVSGIYISSVWVHKPEYPALRLGEARYTVKLNARLFDYLTIDGQRHKEMPTPADWDRGTQLNMKEVRRMNSGKYAGQVEHKYDYSAVQFDTPAFGWSSTKAKVGLWVVNPSIEYLGGGPTKVELTGHLDVNRGAAPVLCNYWVGSHYGGSAFRVAARESWSKTVGPFLLYCNSGKDHEALWREALRRAKAEAEAWPYAWAADAHYPAAAGRGTVTGKLTVVDPQAPKVRVRNLLVGLAPAAAGTDWQRDATSYQFWVRANGPGSFTIPHVRPGTYTLYAIADGVLGEFRRPGVVVAAGRTSALGTLKWTPVRYGKQLWEIGVPDRTAREFRHGDHYWQWGLYLKYPEEFPRDVNFVIGKSDWSKDWNYCQPPRIVDGRATPTTWSITFDLPEAPRGQATLRLAIAGSRGRGGVRVSVNGQAVGGTGPLPDTGVMHRDGIRGYWVERDVTFDAGLLKAGTNVIRLTNPGRSWVEGVLYDYLRLELGAPPMASKDGGG